MINRIALTQIVKQAKQFPVVCILGPRQCGKTTLAKHYQKLLTKTSYYFDLESPSDIRKMAEPELLFSNNKDAVFVIDEVQRMPELFSILRAVADAHKKKGRFILLGSANPELIKGVSETLAGRIAYISVYPFHLTELPYSLKTQEKHWFRGGFPDAYLAKSNELFFNWMDAFMRTFIERDLNNLFGITFSPAIMFRLWRMLAHHHGGLWNAQSFAKGLDVSPTTVNRYVDYLEGAFMIRKLMPYYANIGKQLVKSPKIYFCDTGLLHHLSDIISPKQLLVHPVIGFSWESYVIEQICQLLPGTIHPYFYRTHDGSELDLVLVKGIKIIATIEIKWSSAPKISRGHTESIKSLNCKQNYLIIPQDEPVFPITPLIKTVGLRYFLNTVLPKIII